MEQKESKKKKVLRITLVVVISLALILGTFLGLYYSGLWQQFNSVEKMRELIQHTGFWGRLVFFCLQFLQVTFIPIPSTILSIAGAILFGPLQGSLISLAGILLGSAVAFLLGQTFGKRLVVFMVGEESCKKWTKYLSRAKFGFAIMMLLPMFPDDILCLVAGLTDMSWNFFMITNIIARPIGIFMTSYLGSGDFIPYSGWGLAVWGAILVVSFAAVFVTTKYQKQIEGFIYKKFKKRDWHKVIIVL